MATKNFDININEQSPIISDINLKLNTKANKTELEDLETKEAHNNDIKNINNKLDLKADKTDLNNLETKEAHNNDIKNINNKLDSKANKTDLDSKQDKLVSNGDNQNIKTINGQDILGKGDIKISAESQFTENEVILLKSILAKAAFGINKNTQEVEHFGFFTEVIMFNDLDKPDDNLVTNGSGEWLPIRRVAFFHYSGTGWYDSTSALGVRYYEDKLTYKDKEVLTEE